MQPATWFGVLAATLPVLFAAAVEAAPAPRAIEFRSLDPGQSWRLHGTLYLPDDRAAPHRALVVMHGTLGIDARNELYRDALLKEGIATFEIDYKTGVYRTVLRRPRPAEIVPVAYAALQELRKLPEIDPDRIAIMGYSLGGHAAVDTAFESNRGRWLHDAKGFAAHVAFYPVSRPYLEQADLAVTGAPMIILYGTADSYGEGDSIPAFVRLLEEKARFKATVVPYPGASHDFNLDAPADDHWDPVAVGHRSHTEWNADAAHDSVVRVVEFLRSSLSGG
jgi:dienelactone hydrolase